MPNDAALRCIRSVAAEVLGAPVDLDEPLAAQGLDSIGAQDLLDLLARQHGLQLPLAQLLVGTIRSLAPSCARIDHVAAPTLALARGGELPLAGPQTLWASLATKGWASWANISLCVSVPASRAPPAFLAAMAQGLCDANDALRMGFVRAPAADAAAARQKVHPSFAVPVRIEPSPARDADALRAAHDFEGEEISPYGPTARALVLAGGSRHWLCLTAHHAFCDRAGMRALHAQLRQMLANNELRPPPPSAGYAECALALERLAGPDRQRSLERLVRGVSLRDPQLRGLYDIGALPTAATLSQTESDALAALAPRLGTTLPLLLHALVAALTARLLAPAGDANGGACSTMLCHVVHNRSQPASRGIVGCFDTSVPVPLVLGRDESLASYCARTAEQLASASELAAAAPRGSFLRGMGLGDHELFERVPHLNIQRADDEAATSEPTAHPLHRVQRTRWGLLLRIALPAARPSRRPPASQGGESGAGGAAADVPKAISTISTINLTAFSEHRPLAVTTCFCLVRLVRALLAHPRPRDAPVIALVDGARDLARTASAQVKAAARTVRPSSADEAFIWQRLVERQKRWYAHDEQMALRRDEHNRFVGTAANPFPFTQLDKLAERAFLDGLGVPQPRLLHAVPIGALQAELPRLAPRLPASFVVKPVGAGHSFGVTVVRDGRNVTRGVAFDALSVADELVRMSAAGGCQHEGKFFAFNFSHVLIEECVVDELGLPTPADYKVFVLGGTLLWVQVRCRVALGPHARPAARHPIPPTHPRPRPAPHAAAL